MQNIDILVQESSYVIGRGVFVIRSDDFDGKGTTLSAVMASQLHKTYLYEDGGFLPEF
jgi:hypothetical protein